jgi:hypothetical protein
MELLDVEQLATRKQVTSQKQKKHKHKKTQLDFTSYFAHFSLLNALCFVRPFPFDSKLNLLSEEYSIVNTGFTLALE